jgi:hypothetical protein
MQTCAHRVQTGVQTVIRIGCKHGANIAGANRVQKWLQTVIRNRGANRGEKGCKQGANIAWCKQVQQGAYNTARCT